MNRLWVLTGALVFGVAVTPTTSAQPAVDQRPPGPADPASPGALIVPDVARDRMEEMKKRENPPNSKGDRGGAREGDRNRSGSGRQDGTPAPPGRDGNRP
jgi:hypothetical protein